MWLTPPQMRQLFFFCNQMVFISQKAFCCMGQFARLESMWSKRSFLLLSENPTQWSRKKSSGYRIGANASSQGANTEPAGIWKPSFISLLQSIHFCQVYTYLANDSKAEWGSVIRVSKVGGVPQSLAVVEYICWMSTQRPLLRNKNLQLYQLNNASSLTFVLKTKDKGYI